MTDPIKALEHAVEYSTGVARNVRPEQLDDPTPCEGWDVRTLLRHVANGSANFVAAVTGTPLDDAVPGDDELVAEFERRARAELAAFRSEGALERTIDMPFPGAPGAFGARIHAMDLLVHGWDLARATGQDAPIDDAVAEDTIEFMRPVVAGLTRGEPDSSFAHEVEVAPDAPPTERLLALLGRTP